MSALQSELLKINRIFYKRLYTVKGLTQKVQQVGFHPGNLYLNIELISWEMNELSFLAEMQCGGNEESG